MGGILNFGVREQEWGFPQARIALEILTAPASRWVQSPLSPLVGWQLTTVSTA
ncbi:hypothetical protein FRC08_014884 [Ceratobasidium sp. 394]|nr:hypothetical protein FRC08_014884 [Ceratobasidium sp. 394]